MTLLKLESKDMQNNEADNKRIDFLIEVYKLRVQFHSEHIDRLWTRFNFLLTTEIALLGLFFTIWADNNSWNGFVMFPILGIIVSVLWYILGAQDHYYFEGFRKQIWSLEKAISKELAVSALEEYLFDQVKDVKFNLVTWRWKIISLSKLIAIFPILFLILWVVMLFLIH